MSKGNEMFINLRSVEEVHRILHHHNHQDPEANRENIVLDLMKSIIY